MSADGFEPRSFGGGVLKGGKLVRCVYLDEAGISNPKQEPYLVVAAVIVDADRTWRALETRFRELSAEVDPDHDGHPVVFHAKDIWHGSGRFDRQTWPLPKRLALMSKLAAIPKEFGLTVAIGYVKRSGSTPRVADGREQGVPMRRDRVSGQAVAFLNAVRRVDAWMQKHASEETAMLFAEDTHEVKAMISAVHEAYTNRATTHPQAFVTQHIVDAVHFAKKDSSRLLQIADHCAFIAKRKLMQKADIEPFYAAIAPQLYMTPAHNSSLVITVDVDDLEFLD